MYIEREELGADKVIDLYYNDYASNPLNEIFIKITSNGSIGQELKAMRTILSISGFDDKYELIDHLKEMYGNSILLTCADNETEACGRYILKQELREGNLSIETISFRFIESKVEELGKSFLDTLEAYDIGNNDYIVIEK